MTAKSMAHSHRVVTASRCVPLRIENSLMFASLMLAASMTLLTACSSSDGSASDLGRKVKVTPGNGGGSTTGGSAQTPTPTPTPTPSSTYDASVGNGVDAAGFADLPLRAGAHRYFVSSATGSDGNGCAAAQSPAAPKATITAAVACVADGAGDQVLVAQRTTYAAAFPNMSLKGGFDHVHPTVIESYDPADALNEAKYGR